MDPRPATLLLRSTATAAALGVLLLSATACGGGDDTDSPPATASDLGAESGELTFDLVQGVVAKSGLLGTSMCKVAQWEDGIYPAEQYGDVAVEKVYSCYPSQEALDQHGVSFSAVTYLEYNDATSAQAYLDAETPTGDVIVAGPALVSFGAATGDDVAVFDALGQDLMASCGCGQLIELDN